MSAVTTASTVTAASTLTAYNSSEWRLFVLIAFVGVGSRPRLVKGRDVLPLAMGYCPVVGAQGYTTGEEK